MLVNSGLSALANALKGTPMNINYIAIGDGSSLVAVDNVKLANEVFRKQISSITSEENTIYITSFIDKNEANFNWTELGIFANGTATKDSGTLIARVLVNEMKDSYKTATIIWELNLERR